MGMPEMAQTWTREMVLALPEDRNRYELVDGELVVTPSPGVPHQSVLGLLHRALDRYLESCGLGRVLCSPADLQLVPGEVLQPDLFVVRLAEGQSLPQRWEEIRDLLLVIEIVSASSARIDRMRKRHRYQRARVPEYWVVDPFSRLIERWQPDDERPAQLAEALAWQPDGGVAPLVIDVAELFREALGDDPLGIEP